MESLSTHYAIDTIAPDLIADLVHCPHFPISALVIFVHLFCSPHSLSTPSHLLLFPTSIIIFTHAISRHQNKDKELICTAQQHAKERNDIY